jgi:hypothetical protein
MTLLWIKENNEWYTIAQGSTKDINNAIIHLTRLYPHTSYKTQQVDNYDLYKKHFITQKFIDNNHGIGINNEN